MNESKSINPIPPTFEINQVERVERVGESGTAQPARGHPFIIIFTSVVADNYCLVPQSC